jgi:hypothetical protein
VIEEKKLEKVEGQTLVFADGSVAVGSDVHVKLDGQTASLADLQAGDRVELHNVGDALAVVKVRRKTPSGAEASTSKHFPAGHTGKASTSK